MAHGWTGKQLRIDLTTSECLTSSSREICSQYLGGKGINAKILWDEVKPGTPPLDPENRLIFGTGPLTATLTPTSCKGSVTTKSPLTGLFGDSSLGGFWPASLKFAGYDQLILSGASDKPVYLFINNDTVQIRDAGHLWGRDVLEATARIQEDLYAETGDRDIQVVCIGPAGENRVASAGIMSSLSNSASRTGPGAVMGSKNLKAIAIRGTRDLAVARPREMIKLCNSIMKNCDMLQHTVKSVWEEVYYLAQVSTYGNNDELPSGELALSPNIGEKYRDITKDFAESYTRAYSCFNCPLACRSFVDIPGQEPSAFHCESWINPNLKIKSLDLKAGAQLFIDCQRLGLDYFSLTSTSACLMELAEKGILSAKDTDGLPVKWGDMEGVRSFARKLAHKVGSGRLFAEGLVKAAGSLGAGAGDYVIHIKGMEVPSYSLYFPPIALAAAINERGDLLRSIGAVLGFLLLAPEEFANRALGFLPEDFRGMYNETKLDFYKNTASIVHYFEKANSLSDMLGVCRWAVQFMPGGFMSLPMLSGLLSSAVGDEFPESAMDLYHERATTLIRSFNIREGMRKSDDTIPETAFNNISPRLGVALDRKLHEESKKEYYGLHGWDENGFPEKDTLEKLGLAYVSDDLKGYRDSYLSDS